MRVISLKHANVFVATIVGVTSLCVACAQVAPDVIAKGKRATALVVVKPSEDAGSAFSIGGGFFVTNQHVVESANVNGRISIVLNPGDANQRVVPATLVRVDKANDLALLKTSLAAPALEFGDTRALVETAPVVAFGFPFGADLALEAEEYPSVTVTTGKISALRKSRGELQKIQLDASLSFGNSGGPVLNSRGQVIGVVEEGIFLSNVNFAIPVDKVKAFVSKPEIIFKPPVVRETELATPASFEVQVISFVAGPPTSVTLTLTTEGAAPRVLPVSPAGEGRFSVVAKPVGSTGSASKPPQSIDYVITVKQEGQTTGEQTGAIYIEGKSSSAKQGVLILSADETILGSLDQAPGTSGARFVSNLTSFFTGGKPGRFLIYSNNPCYGPRFQQAIKNAGHAIEQSVKPASLKEYDGVFAGGFAEVDLQLMTDYVRQGGKLYLAGGADSAEPVVFNAFLKPFGLAFGETDFSEVMLDPDGFVDHPLFKGVFGLHSHGFSPVSTIPGSGAKMIATRKGVGFMAIATAKAMSP
jgi:hypothetical protein